MPIDPALKDALRTAVEEFKQPAAVAERLEGWLDGLSEGDDSADVQRRNYDAVFGKLKAGSDDED